MPKRSKRVVAVEGLAKLLGEHLSKFPASKQRLMHERFEKRAAKADDSESKKPLPRPAEIRR